MEECVFCKIIDRKIAANIVYEDEYILAFRDINPKAPVHILIIPKKHIATLMDIKESDRELIGNIYLAAQKIAAGEAIDKKGFRLVQNCNRDAGQEVFHIHFHLLGGWKME